MFANIHVRQYTRQYTCPPIYKIQSSPTKPKPANGLRHGFGQMVRHAALRERRSSSHHGDARGGPSRWPLSQPVPRTIHCDCRDSVRALENSAHKMACRAFPSFLLSMHQMHRMLDISYKSTGFMTHRLREAMRSGDLHPMGGPGSIVAADETSIGSKDTIKRRGHGHKNAVLSLIDRNNGQVRSFHVEGTSAADIVPIIKANVAKETAMMTDEGGSAITSRPMRASVTKQPVQARHEGRLSALQRKAPSPLCCRVRLSLHGMRRKIGERNS